MVASPGEVAMPTTVTVDLQLVHEARGVPDENAIGRLFGAALTASVTAPYDVEVSVRVVGEEEMRDLNSRFRGNDATTNVLSFPADHEAFPGIES